MHLFRGRPGYKFAPIPRHHDRGWHLFANLKWLRGMSVDECNFPFLLNSLQALRDHIIHLLQNIQNKQ